MRTRTKLLAGLGALAILAAACGGNGNGGPPPDGGNGGTDAAATSVNIELAEFSVTPSTGSAPAGSIEFVVQNAGSIPHEFNVVQTDVAPDALPVAGGVVDEAEVAIVDEIQPFDAGTSQTRMFELDAGSYVLICNIAGHYQAGMNAAFTVG